LARFVVLVILEFKRYFATNYEPFMRSILSERNLVVLLFVMVLVTFSLAHEDTTKKMEQINQGVSASTIDAVRHWNLTEVQLQDQNNPHAAPDGYKY
jgi:hypothetical protein